MLIVEVGEDCGPFAGMLAGLIDANLRADPAKLSLVRQVHDVVGFAVSDTGEECRLRLADGTLSMEAGSAAVAPLWLEGTADQLLGLSTVRLRFGLPDLLTSSGRGVTGRWIGGALRVHGLPLHAPLLRTVMSLVNVLG